MPDSSEHLAIALKELEARRESLRSRLKKLDSAIAGIQYLHEPVPVSPVAADLPLPVEQTEPVREVATSVVARSAAPKALTTPVPSPAPVVEQATVLADRRQYESSQSGNRGQDSQVQRPKFKAPQERRRTAKLNVYHNQNSDWALGQIIPQHSPRAVFRYKASQRCPDCGSQDTRVSFTRGFADYFMFLLDYTNARCRKCDRLFRIWRTRPDEDTQDLEPQTSLE